MLKEKGVNMRHAEKNKNKVGKGDPAANDPKTWVAKLLVDSNPEEAKSTHDHPISGDWWEFDLGTTRGFHGDIAAFSDYKPFDAPIPISLAGNGATTNVLGTGALTIQFLPPNSPPVTFRISNAYHTPGIMNLISIGHLDNLGPRIQFFSKGIDIWNSDELGLSIPHEGNTCRC